jgi:hypothetical protein
MTTIIFTKDELFNLVSQETIYLSDPIGTSEDNTAKRLSDVLPLTEDDRDYFNTKLYSVGVSILNKIGAYLTDVDDTIITDPYVVTDGTDVTYPNSVIFKFAIPAASNLGVITPQVQQYMTEAIVKYIVKEWLKVKGYPYQMKEQEYEESLKNIKSSFMYGRKATVKIRTL